MKNRYIAALLAFFLGGLGVHKFYLGKWTGVIYLLFCWTYIPSIIALIEGILYLTKGEEAFNEKYNGINPATVEHETEDVGFTDRYIMTYDNTANSLKCPKCGHINEVGSNFCEKCGQKL